MGIGIEEMGNVERYKHEPREVIVHETLLDPWCILKYYEMCKKGFPFKQEFVDKVKSFLEVELINDKIKEHSGLGFAILSEDMLNVARWDEDYPIVLRNDIYTFKNQDLTTAKLEDIRDVGAFCIWELGIVNFEREQWIKYLRSERSTEDKWEYIMNVIQDPLGLDKEK